jgi:hypothetical protein
VLENNSLSAGALCALIQTVAVTAVAGGDNHPEDPERDRLYTIIDT